MIVSRKIFAAAILATAGLSAGASYAMVNATAHPQLAAAQDLISQAQAQVTAAQQAHNYSLGGHAANANALLTQASSEIDAAAAAAQ